MEEEIQKETRSNFWKEIAKLAIISIIIVIPFRLYIAKPFIVNGASMDPTFESGDYLIVDELTYHFKNPERGAVIVFKYPLDPSKSFIKRIIGLPGDKISVNDNGVTITNKEHPEGFTFEELYIVTEKKGEAVYTLKEGQYFVMGDNRSGSADSRIWGPVPEDNIIGRPIVRFYPPGILPGDYSKILEKTLNQN